MNAANARLVLGGGVAGAIRRRGGPGIQAECNRLAPINVGEAVMTKGGSLKARYVIHAVGPRMGEGGEEQKLATATLNSLRLAEEAGLKSLAFPAISTGVYGYPLNRCAKVMLKACIEYLSGETGISRVIFCLYDHDAFSAFARELGRLVPLPASE